MWFAWGPDATPHHVIRLRTPCNPTSYDLPDDPMQSLIMWFAWVPHATPHHVIRLRTPCSTASCDSTEHLMRTTYATPFPVAPAILKLVVRFNVRVHRPGYFCRLGCVICLSCTTDQCGHHCPAQQIGVVITALHNRSVRPPLSCTTDRCSNRFPTQQIGTATLVLHNRSVQPPLPCTTDRSSHQCSDETEMLVAEHVWQPHTRANAILLRRTHVLT